MAGMIWALVWYLLYREPNQHKGVSETELNYLRDNGALLENRQGSQPQRARWADLA
ncbi:major facilitator superfamily protein [Plautia stali symbiont]|nr:major facilitator superfamily protein [Plautia stali symbiont]